MDKPVKPPSVTKTMKHELYHLAVSLILGFMLARVFDDIWLGLFTLLAGMLLDADHMLDYLLYLLKYRKPFSLKEFLAGSYFPIWKKFITPLHSWELAVAAFIGYFIFAQPYLLGLSLALIGHYIIDYITNDVNKKAYFLLFRLSNSFNKAAIKK